LIETGIKSDLLDRRLRINLTPFYSKINQVQIPVLACPDSPCAAHVNAGGADSKRIELEGLARAVDGFTVDASYSYLNFHFASLIPGAEDSNNPAGASHNNPPAGSPENKSTLGPQYESPMGGGGSITPRVGLDYQGKVYVGPNVIGAPPDQVRELTHIRAYTLVNGRLTWSNAAKNVAISLEGLNLTDEYYYVTVFDLRGRVPASTRASLVFRVNGHSRSRKTSDVRMSTNGATDDGRLVCIAACNPGIGQLLA
jgi:iron complex outermembrane recepter protein